MGNQKNMKRKIRRALISVSDKSELIKILPILRKFKVEILSSGGTFKYLKKHKFKCSEIQDFTGFKEILDGRVKTLHPKIHSGILFKRDNRKHVNQIKKQNYKNIDLVIVNFYPFERTILNTKNENKIIENIDIGGPALVRSAAKNFKDVAVITSNYQLNSLVHEMNTYKGSTSLKFRKKLSQEAFNETAYYDTNISEYFNKIMDNKYPNKITFNGTLISKLRYGENPHQSGALYSGENFNELEKLNGKELSYNNYNDIYFGLDIINSLPKGIGTTIIKHANPSGVSIDKNQILSFKQAFNCDPISAFGGVIICNYKIRSETAREISNKFFEVIVARDFDDKALSILRKKKNLRIIKNNQNSNSNQLVMRALSKNFILQTSDNKNFNKRMFKVVSKNKPNKKMFNDLVFAFNICRFVKSNAIVLTNNNSTVGIGSGQPSRIDSCEIAVNKMKKFNHNSENLVAASDAFFPFIDGIESLVQSGAKAIIQPYGSIRDKEIIKFANNTNTVLVFSKTRHFRH
tara:strand:+ start:1747 stop:3303 length:1557 start_codon:yes stop_codon:yes gene_type:complete